MEVTLHFPPKLFQIFLFSLILSITITSPLGALPMGINKVRYHTDLKWKILETEHFEIYHSMGYEDLAKAASRFAEDSFRTVSRTLEFVPKTKIPLFVYGDPLQFQGTNIVSGFLPDGVAGFTEVFKNRVAVPMNGSFHEFEKVILHEIVHAFQYDLIYGEGWRSLNLFKAVFVPQWMMEGSAEWVADHWESQGEMVVRDAVLNDGLMPLSMLESFNHFEQVYLAYKESQSILEYVAQVYGKSKVPQMLKSMTTNQSPDAVARKHLGVSLDELYSDWSFFMKSSTWSRIKGMPAPSRYGEPFQDSVMKTVVSPDGKKIACLNGGELFLLDPANKERRPLLKRKFQTQGSGVAWSPDSGTLAFVANPGGRQTLHTYETKTGRVTELRVPGLTLLLSPEWAPDGEALIFSGFDQKMMDLYRFEIASGNLKRLTQDKGFETWAKFSSDGKELFFITEEAGETKLERFGTEGPFPASKEMVPCKDGWGKLSSLFSSKNGLYLTSDRDRRIFNLYHWREGKGLTQLTRSFADVLSVAPNPAETDFFAVLYQKGVQTLHRFQEGSLERIQDPPSQLEYLTNSFGAASGIIASRDQRKPATGVEPHGPTEKAHGPGLPESPSAAGIPGPVEKLEVQEASNIVQLRWGTEKGELDNVTHYRIYRATGEESAFEALETVPADRKSGFVDYDVKEDGIYLYQVTAVNSQGESSPSPVVRTKPGTKLSVRNYDFNLSPDLLLFIAGYDSSLGFVGGGVLQMSDHLGDHRFSLLGDTIPGVRTGLEANYEFSLWRTKFDLRFFYYENFFRILELQTGGIVNEYRNNENGVDLSFEYPVDENTRFEYGLGTQRFKGSPNHLRFSGGISNYFEESDRWSIANYYRVSFIQDRRRARRFTPSGGHGVNFTLIHALPLVDYNVSFANLLLETQAYWDLEFLNHLVIANRVILMSSQGPDPQTFFIGNDEPFQAYFTTIRGHGSRTFFGKNLGLFNLELRYPLVSSANSPLAPLSFVVLKDIELSGFLDIGVVSNHLTDLDRSPVLGSAGVGLRLYSVLYQRAMMMLRFDLAWRLDRTSDPVFHFNLAPMF